MATSAVRLTSSCRPYLVSCGNFPVYYVILQLLFVEVVAVSFVAILFYYRLVVKWLFKVRHYRALIHNCVNCFCCVCATPEKNLTDIGKRLVDEPVLVIFLA